MGSLEEMPFLKNQEVQLGVPTVNADNQTIELSYAFGTDCHPKEWMEKSEAEKEWIKIRE